MLGNASRRELLDMIADLKIRVDRLEGRRQGPITQQDYFQAHFRYVRTHSLSDKLLMEAYLVQEGRAHASKQALSRQGNLERSSIVAGPDELRPRIQRE